MNGSLDDAMQKVDDMREALHRVLDTGDDLIAALDAFSSSLGCVGESAVRDFKKAVADYRDLLDSGIRGGVRP